MSKVIPPALVGQQCKDASGNRYEVVAHYGGNGTPFPEMVNLDLIARGPLSPFRSSPLPYIGALNRELFDTRFQLVKPQ